MPLVHLLRSDYVRVRTLRSNLLIVSVSALALVAMAFTMARSMDGRSTGLIVAEPVTLPMEYLAYVVLVLAVLVVTADIEVGTAAVAASLVGDPRRVLLSKFIVAAGLSLAVAVPVLVLTVMAAAVGDGGGVGDILSSEAASAITADVLAIPLAAIIGVAVGALLRSSALSISLLLLWSLAAETVLVFVVEERYAAFLPFKTIGGSRVAMDHLGPLEGVAVFAAYALVIGALAWFVTARRSEAVR